MKSQKFLFLIILGILVFSFLIPQSAQSGLVPCGIDVNKNQTIDPEEACQFCHFFVLFKNIVEFLLIPQADLNQGVPLVPLVAVLMLVIAGAMFFFYAESPDMIKKARSLIKAVVIGLVLIYGAWLIIGLFFQVIGLADWTKNIYQNWWRQGLFQIECPTK